MLHVLGKLVVHSTTTNDFVLCHVKPPPARVSIDTRGARDDGAQMTENRCIAIRAADVPVREVAVVPRERLPALELDRAFQCD